MGLATDPLEPGDVGRTQQASSALVHGAIVVGTLATSSAALLVRHCQAPALGIATWRLTLATVGFMFALHASGGRRFRLLDPEMRSRCLLAGLFLALHFACWITSLQRTSVAIAALLVNTSPLFVALGDTWLLASPPGRRLLASLALSVAGSVLVAWGDLGRAAP